MRGLSSPWVVGFDIADLVYAKKKKKKMACEKVKPFSLSSQNVYFMPIEKANVYTLNFESNVD